MTVITTGAVSTAISDENSEGVPGSSPAPTEYGQSYTYYSAFPRPRNAVPGWQTRNVSNILPSGPEFDPARASQRRSAYHQNWPWLARQTGSQIFPGQQATAATATTTDFNNNVGGLNNGIRRRTIWPWQARAQESGIGALLSDGSQPVPASTRTTHTSPTSRPEHRTRWPWQDRAMKSVIFEDDLAPKPLKHRNYQWDQRQSSSVDAAVHQNYPMADKNDKKKKQAWPWEERAQQSVVFRSPDKVKLPRQVKYVWDQRKTRLSVKVDPKAKFPEGSLYTDSFVKWKPGQGVVAPAGKPCYNDDDDDDKETDRNVNASRKKYINKNSSSSSSSKMKQTPSLVLSPPLKKCSSSSVKGSSCLEIVPMGYKFPNANGK